jgi:DNA primase
VYNEYLQSKRRITTDTIERFALGLSPESGRDFIAHAQSKGISPDILVKAGLAGRGDRQNDYYDRFRRRLMIPIQNLSDKTIAFGGRALSKDDQAKYINSPETALYNKSAVLYGLNMTRDAIRTAGSVIIVEGYFDLISLWQIGVKNVVASSGTAFTNQQGRLLKRFADKAYLFFDADSAGVKAAIRSVDALYNSGVEVMVITAPEGEDPDSVSQQGPDAVNKLVESADRYLQFRMRRFDSANAGLVERNEFIGDLATVAARISDPALQALFIAEAAEGVGVNAELFSNKSSRTPQYDEDDRPQGRSGAQLSEDDWGARGTRTIEAEMISLLLTFPTLLDQAAERISADNFKSPRLRDLFTEMIKYFASGADSSLFVGGLTDSQLRETASLLLTRRWENDAPGATLSDYLDKIITISETRPSIDALKNELKAAESSGNSEEAARITEELMRRLSH